jgi:protein-glutamine gamma-glutamyltransferase
MKPMASNPSTAKRSGPSAHRVYTRAMLQAAIGSVLVFGAADMNLPYIALSLLGIACVWLFSIAPRRPAPRLMINTTLLLVVVIAGIEMLRMGVGVNSFAIFVTLLMVVKMLDLRTPRDDGQVLVLCVAIMIAGVLTSNTLITGLFMLVSILLILRAVVLYQIHAVLSKSTHTNETINTKARIDIRSMILATGFLCSIIGSAIFVVLPRNIGVQAFGQWGQGASVSGFADTVELGRPGFISQSSTPVLDLTISDRNGMNVGSENSRAVYLRGAVLNEYRDGRWSPSPIMRSPLQTRTTLIPSNTSLESHAQIDTTQWEHQYTISIRSLDNGPAYLFAPWKTVEFRVGDEPIRLGLDFERGIFIKDGIGGNVQYAVRTLNTQFDPIDYQQLTSRSPITQTAIEPEIIQLAQGILTDAGIEPMPKNRPMKDDASALRVIEQHLRSQYEYTLDAQPVPQGMDATKWFLFERKAGHCEYYASALALMARAVGIPARVLTGYIASDFNSVTGQYVVRESNAHAWVEAQIAPGRWRIFDGTPPVDFHALHEPDPSFWRSITKLYESVEFLWVRSVVGFDSTSRQNLIGSTSTDIGLSAMGESLVNRFAAGRQRLIYHGALVGIVVFCASLFLGIVLLKYKQACAIIWDQLRNRLAYLYAKIFRRQSPSDDPHHARLESMIHLALHRLGIPKPAWFPLKAHIRGRLASHDSITEPVRQAIFEASDLLYRAKFSQDPEPIDPTRLHDIESALRKSEKSASRVKNN